MKKQVQRVQLRASIQALSSEALEKIHGGSEAYVGFGANRRLIVNTGSCTGIWSANGLSYLGGE